MANRPASRPTEAELEILGILWARGPSTVREVHHALQDVRPTKYTTALKHLQIMTHKGWVEKDAGQRPQVYRPRQTRARTQRRMVGDLLDRVFSGSPRRMVIQALSSRPSSPEDLAAIRRLIDDLEEIFLSLTASDSTALSTPSR